MGLGLMAILWPLNWLLPGPRTHLIFFPLWTGLVLTLDALVFLRRGDSLLVRSLWRFIGLFLVSIPIWWLFEILNWRVKNWHYIGRELFSNLEYGFLASLSFSTVVPAVFEAAELVSTFLPRPFPGRLRIRFGKRLVLSAFVTGWLMLASLWAWPRYCFPFLWISLYLIVEPINWWLGHPTLFDDLTRGEWRSIFALWGGVMICAFFWEFWNYWSFPKWVYTVPSFVDFWHIFEMPFLGYGGYLPFALELYAFYRLVEGALKLKSPYLRLAETP